jgi:hypothetical protein
VTAFNPIQYYGLTCEFAVLSLFGGLASYFHGGDVSVYGLALDSVVEITVAGQTVPRWTMAEVNERNRSQDEVRFIQQFQLEHSSGVLQQINFHAPSLISSSSIQTHDFRRTLQQSSSVQLISAYQPLVLRSTLPSNSGAAILFTTTPPTESQLQAALTKVQLSNQLFYTASTCTQVGEYQEDGDGGCTACPQGGFWSVAMQS